ncbi:DNA mismatch repair endonuclease MutL [Planctomycetaceae bacterium]|jgi:DNA mismatch repair protein MutL|nr:DNA mismatch repair endonuclease MutL [Planctomycetaceae bacterium]MDC0307880.1 DNA mismatch repair endonuclease MutL [Planctomycetaceae bacterium]MDG2391056.1 DNA mismatch repair endonuclease MutL [Planctomycetaceae bacterium]
MSTTVGPRIRQLEATVINKIAAGEVIERPASVVKELLENSADALSTRIEVDLIDGGAELIRIVDDGEGIHPDDFELAVSSHATSKIVSDQDLFSVHTMGFRGEALASIASVSKFRIRSRQQDSDSAYELKVDGGKLGAVTPAAGPFGTSIEVRQLFHNTPVRRKFLKTKATEYAHATEYFTRVALARPNLHMVLRHQNKVSYELPATENLVERLRMFYGNDLTSQLIRVEREMGEMRLWGYVAHPSHNKANRKGQYLFLNGRWIQDRTVQAAISEAYRGLVMVGRQPVVFLFLEMPSDQVDVNVHPSKWEVRFQDSQQIYRLVLSAIRDTFLGMDLNGSMSGPAGKQSAHQEETSEQKQLKLELTSWAKSQLEQAESEFVGIEPQLVPPAAIPPVRSSSEGTVFTPANDASHAGESQVPSSVAEGVATPLPSPPQTYLGGEIRAMQVMECYLLVDDPSGVMIIDQHALHERIMYEYLRPRVLEGTVESQQLLMPLTIELTSSETVVLLDHQDLLSEFGYGVEEFGGNTILLNRYPVMLQKADHAKVLRDLVIELDTPGRKPSRRDLVDSLLHMMSCKAAVKAGHRLTPEEIESLLAKRHLVDDAHHCPHGRPTAMVLTQEQLDKQFGRLGA